MTLLPRPPVTFFDEALSLPLPAMRELILENATYAWAVEKQIVAATINLMTVQGGLGIEKGAMIISADRERQRKWTQMYSYVVRTPVKSWKGLDVRHLIGEPSFYQFDVLAALQGALPLLTQETFDFVTCRDMQHAKIAAVVHFTDAMDFYRGNANNDKELARAQAIAHFSLEELNVLVAFRKQMIAEAEPFRHRVASGVYALLRTRLPAVDHEIVYDVLRLVITPVGIVGSVVVDGSFQQYRSYAPFFWTPEGISTSQVWYHPMGVFALDAMLSCIWRDACIVRDVWTERTARSIVVGRAPAAANTTRKVVVMPRKVYHVRWGTNDAERSSIEHIARRAHHVGACYVELHDGWEAHDADIRAAQYGWPAPPDGFTFRAPHNRGGDTASNEAKQIICKGLLTANVLMGRGKKRK